ncbi:hypothetical protein NDI56_16215 [Haloarcula sp. S1CR25-12]|uniref:JAB domain-containing protein n=1 Tax=Haloarcula saliterrae TaxID=2950534 RepID=A0ABU2FFD2_9EURY|nr:hypothetical protein [Haloarcula sp. S1CR25-12]MDS0260947.1 hypothetical protein [Haloarcula sp. S1CR25-12]
MTITSNRKNLDVTEISTSELEPGTSTTVGGLRVHTISVGDDDSDGDAAAGVRAATSPDQPSIEDDTTAVEPDTRPAGSFVVPANRDFLQKLESRGKDGQGRLVETMYVLTGPTRTQPTDLIGLENPAFYGSVTRTSLEFNPTRMAEKVASLYPAGNTPGLVARFHTHPSGSVSASHQDKQSAPAVESAFVDAFGTDDFEFFHGIHGLEEHGESPGPEQRQDPSVTDDVLEWVGERYRHRLGVFGRGFDEQQTVTVNRGDQR